MEYVGGERVTRSLTDMSTSRHSQVGDTYVVHAPRFFFRTGAFPVLAHRTSPGAYLIRLHFVVPKDNLGGDREPVIVHMLYGRLVIRPPCVQPQPESRRRLYEKESVKAERVAI